MYNHLAMQGNLTRDVEVKQIGETTLAEFTVACSNKYKKKENTVFMDCVAWGKTAEVIAKFFSKGKPIMVNGSVEQDTWEDKESGKKRTKIKLKVNGFDFVGGSSGSRTDATAKPANAIDISDCPF